MTAGLLAGSESLHHNAPAVFVSVATATAKSTNSRHGSHHMVVSARLHSVQMVCCSRAAVLLAAGQCPLLDVCACCCSLLLFSVVARTAALCCIVLLSLVVVMLKRAAEKLLRSISSLKAEKGRGAAGWSLYRKNFTKP